MDSRHIECKRRFGLVLTFLIAALLASGCSKLDEQDFQPRVLDPADLLDQQTEEWLASFDYPGGFAFVIQSVDEVPEALIGAQADDLFAATVEESPEEDALEKRGVFVLLSKSPSLVQVRVGEDLQSLARWGGVIAGPDYIAKQRLATSGDFNGSVQVLIPWLSQRLPEVTNIPWHRKLLFNDLMAELSSELEDLALPSESFYGHYLLKPILELRVLEKSLFGTWWVTYVLLGLLLLIAKRIVNTIFGATAAGLERTARQSSQGVLKSVRSASDVARILVSIVIVLLFSIPSAASALLLSGARLEDQIAIQSSGIPGVEVIGFTPEHYRLSTGVGIAMLVMILRFAKGVVEQADLLKMAMLPDPVQQEAYEQLQENSPIRAGLLYISGTGGEVGASNEEFEKAPFTYAYFNLGTQSFFAALRWLALAQFFLPRPLSLTIALFWIPPVALGTVATLKAIFSPHRRLQEKESTPTHPWRILLGGGALLLALILIAYPRFRRSASSQALPVGTPLTNEAKLTLRGIGPIRIGMTLEEAERAAQVPLGRTEVAEGEDCYYVNPKPGPVGIYFMIIGGRIARVDIAEPGITSLSGAGVGDNETDVLSLYRGRIEITDHAYTEGGHYLTFVPKDPEDGNYRMIFETDGKVVTSLRAGRLPEVEFVEGCL